MNSKTVAIILGLVSCIAAEYVPRKSCRTECSRSSPCKPGFVCESAGCNRLCRGNKGVLPVEPLWPIDPVRPIVPINTRCITQCQMSSDCGVNGRCVRQGCNRVCENRGIGNILPIGPIIPGLPNSDCRDECRSSIECGVGAACVRRGCSRVCEVGVIDPIYPKGCVDQCNSSIDCKFNQMCVRRGCRNICLVKRKSNSYQH